MSEDTAGLKSLLEAAQATVGWGEVMVGVAVATEKASVSTAREYVSNIRSRWVRGGAVVPNPYFVMADVAGGSSIETKSALKHRDGRSYAGYAAAGASMAITGASLFVPVLLPAAPPAMALYTVRNANGGFTTARHLSEFNAIRETSGCDEDLTRWLDLLMGMKHRKAQSRTIGLANTFNPVSYLKASIAVLSLFRDLDNTRQQAITCKVIAMELHWRAYLEQQHGGAGGSRLATQIIAELMTRRGVMSLLSAYNHLKLIREPAAWMLFADKIASV